MKVDFRKELPLFLVILAVSLGIFFVDLKTPLAEWVLFFIPIALCVRQQHVTAPLYVAGLCSLLLVAGYFLAPSSLDPVLHLVNRVLCVASLWSVAFVIAQVVRARNGMAQSAWQRQGVAQVSQSLLGEQGADAICQKALDTLARFLGASAGVMYRFDGVRLTRVAAHAVDVTGHPELLQPGQGQSGQVALDGSVRVFEDVPEGAARIRGALGDFAPRAMAVAPLHADGQITGVVELAFAQPIAAHEAMRELLSAVGEDIGIGIRSAQYRQQLRELLRESQQQREELQVQQEELRVSNEELEEQGNVLRDSQARLEEQRSELERTNQNLAEHTRRLERQKQQLLHAQKALEENARDLERANRYKSEFLANMSHELRTPLNSSLILSRLLAENKTGRLADEEVRYANTIHAANSDLLDLINEILDLSKIEAGRLDISLKDEPVARLGAALNAIFEPIAQQKQIGFRIEADPDAPDFITTDMQRLQQVLRNLLSNAFKFTDQGEVVLHIAPHGDDLVDFAVRDTGIGIAPHQRDVIFEPFRQADGTTSRKYGGTGLGLSISRELARLLGGEILLESEAGHGSTFTLRVPIRPEVQVQDTEASDTSSRLAGSSHVVPETPRRAPPVPLPMPGGNGAHHGGAHHGGNGSHAHGAEPAPFPVAQIDDDRHKPPRPGRTILIVEDDVRFAQVLYDLVHELDFDCVHTATAEAAVRLAQEVVPCGILLDVSLPDQSGLSVLERLKRNGTTRHIPVHMVSVDDHAQTALQLGAVGYALKPVAREELVQAIHKLEERLNTRMRRVLVVEDDERLRENIGLLLGADDVEIVQAGSVASALDHLSRSSFDCMVMDLMLPDASGYELLEQMGRGGRHAFPPVIIYTGRALTRGEEERLRKYSSSIIIKGARSPERLLDEVSLFLHRVEAHLPPDKQQLLRQARQRDAMFEGRRILLVEDDVRNVFALTAVIEGLGASLEVARNGREALEVLDGRQDIDLVLMDIMMPEMDGISATRAIRRNPLHTDLPIIAITAKAMQDDRQHCLDAGANDYIPKPVDVDKLLSLCRVWLPK